MLVDLPGCGGEEAADRLGVGAHFVPADVRDGAALRRAVARARELGDLRAALSCAAVAPPTSVLGRTVRDSLRDFQRVIDVNLVGTYNLIAAAAEAMTFNDLVDGERGAIVLVASIAAFEPPIGQIAYAASKAGVVGMTLGSARELAAVQVRVSAIAPGFFETPMVAGLSAPAESMARQVPHPSRLGRPSEFGALFLHILENQMLNGEVVRLDGALRMPAR